MTLHPTLDRKRLIRDAAHGRVRRNQTGAWIHQRTDTLAPVPAGPAVNELLAAQWLTEETTGHARPTPLGLSIAGIATRTTT
jgi:hypothetical protein